MSQPVPKGFNEGWVILQLMGGKIIAGYAQAVQAMGSMYIRLDVPESGGVPAYERFYSHGSIYAFTPVDEVEARASAAHLRFPKLPLLDERRGDRR